jgi:hypothetical protein
MEVAGDVPPAGREARDDRCGGREPVEVVEPELDARLVGDREQVQHRVRRSARAGHADNRVLEPHARDE